MFGEVNGESDRFLKVLDLFLVGCPLPPTRGEGGLHHSERGSVGVGRGSSLRDLRGVIDSGTRRLIALLKQADESFRGDRVEPGAYHRNRLRLIAEDRPRRNRVDQATSRDEGVAATRLESFAGDIRPSDEQFGELRIDLAVRLHALDDDLVFLRRGRVLLLNRQGEAVEERLIEDIRADELAVVRPLPLGVGGRHNGEAGSGAHDLPGLLHEDLATFQHGLKAHHLGAAQIDLVKQQHRATLHGDHDRAVLPDSRAVVQAIAADQVILIREDREVDANHLTPQLGADLVDHRRLAIPGQSGHEHREESPGGDHLLAVIEVSVRDESWDAVRDEALDLLDPVEGDAGGGCSRGLPVR